MLREDASRSHVKARREEIVAVYESANQPMVQIPGRAALLRRLGKVAALENGATAEATAIPA